MQIESILCLMTQTYMTDRFKVHFPSRFIIYCSMCYIGRLEGRHPFNPNPIKTYRSSIVVKLVKTKISVHRLILAEKPSIYIYINNKTKISLALIKPNTHTTLHSLVASWQVHRPAGCVSKRNVHIRIFMLHYSQVSNL